MNKRRKRREVGGFASNYDFRRVHPFLPDMRISPRDTSPPITEPADDSLGCDVPTEQDTTDANNSTTTNCLGPHLDPRQSEAAAGWQEYHEWERKPLEQWSQEDARLAAERSGLWGERAKDGTIKPVVSQQPKEEYL